MQNVILNFVSVLLIFGCLPMTGYSEQIKQPPNIAVSKESVSSRIQNLQRLVTTSSGAQRVKASGKKAALQKQDEAIAQLKLATESIQSGDYKKANDILGKVTSIMFEAIRLAGSGDVGIEKQRRDFTARAESVEVLLEAMQRIAVEKENEEKVKPLAKAIKDKKAEAHALSGAGKYVDGRKLLDEAYELAKATIESMRGGDTLVRTLSFASKKEEYEYEVDRNDTHLMLLNVLLAKKKKSSMAERFIERAKELRTQAEQEAEKGSHEAAVTTLEKSTGELVRAIRMTGVYIPG